MRIALISGVVALAGGLAAPVAAGQEPADTDEPMLEGAALPVSLDRIKRRMVAIPPDEQRLLLRLTARVNVYARAQAVELLRGFNIESWTSLIGGRTGGRSRTARPPTTKW